MASIDAIFKAGTAIVASGIEALAGLIIAFSVISAIPRSFTTFLTPDVAGKTEAIRLRLGRWLSLALEFELAADILRTAVAPTWSEIGQLAAIIVLRTLLNYFLQREIDAATARNQPSQ